MDTPSPEEPAAQELRAPLTELHADGPTRRQLHYQFAHQFWPGFLHANTNVMAELLEQPERLATTFAQATWVLMERAIEDAEGREHERTARLPTDLTASVRTAFGVRCVLLTMPAPERVPLAYFIATFAFEKPRLLRSPATRLRIFTLEASMPDNADEPPPTEGPEEFDRALMEIGLARFATVCEWTARAEHLNYGTVEPATADRFLQEVSAIMRDKREPERDARAVSQTVRGSGGRGCD